ncbi:MAG: YraN family protein [Actinobacteria bacterium HGW-Actinobacteria-1]|jgi:putative endonuclease|nr:MAG: YraN family protein [Actinobacteria bacterium HGW-Actinobacteria-1]
MDRVETGRRGEDAAAAYLERIGMTVIDRNWRCPAGEVDVVFLDGTTLVLCEVKTRTTDAKGSPEAAVTPQKQRRIARLAKAYLADAGAEPCAVRFDVISIRVLAEDRALLRHHRDAFTVDG